MKKTQPGISFPASYSRRPGLLATDDERQRMEAKWAKEDHSNLLLLCRHYSIQNGPKMFYELSLALARELYPERKKRGRKSKWTFLNKGALVAEIERLAKNNDPAHGIAWAAKQLAKRELWKSFLETKESNATNADPAEALRKTYYAFKNDKWANVVRDAFKWHERQGTIAEWEELVADFVKNPHPK